MAALRAKTATIRMARGVRLNGKVTDPAGKPVAGAVVIWGEDPYLMTGSQEVRTDGQGAYRFPPLPPMPVTLTVVAEGWAPQLQRAKITTENDPVDVQLTPGHTVRLRFVDEMGQPLPRVSVMIAEWQGGKSLYNHKHPNVLDTKVPTQADEQGLYEWTWAPADEVTYSFFKEGYHPLRDRGYIAGTEHKIVLSR
jgi:hypothetical protein